MEHKLRVIEPEELMRQLPQLLEETESVPLVISGSSMTPFLVHGRDTVYLSKVTEPLKKGDMILYRRASGAYILHRICRARNGTYDLVGDAQQDIEPGIQPAQILAVVKTVRRKGKQLRKGNFWWEFFEHTWLTLLPLRPGIRRLYSAATAWRKPK
jgi:hypothetical protein